VLRARHGYSDTCFPIDERRLGGAEALELCRDKRLVFVGDSLNRNMWESLACILYAAVPDRSRTRIVDDAGSEYRIFRAMVRVASPASSSSLASCAHDEFRAPVTVDQPTLAKVNRSRRQLSKYQHIRSQ
jgi:hypothetical protein